MAKLKARSLLWLLPEADVHFLQGAVSHLQPLAPALAAPV